MEYLLNSQPWVLLLWLITTIFFLILSFVRAKSSPQNLLPAGPSPLPILGNLLTLLSNTSKPHKLFAELATTYGPIMTLKLGSLTTIVITSSTLAKEALQIKHAMFSTPFVLDVVRAHQHDQFTVAFLPASSSQWRFLRRLYSNQLFSNKMLKAMQARRHQKMTESLSYLGECSRARIAIDVGQAIHNAIFNVMSDATFSMDLSGENDGTNRMIEIKDLMDCITKEVGRPNIVDCYPFLKMVDPQRMRHRLTNMCVKLFKLFDEIIDIRLESRKDQQRLMNSAGPFCDLLDVLIDVMEEQPESMSRDQLHHMLMDAIGSGVVTTSKAIEWAMAELLRNPKVLSKSQEEIDNVVGKGKAVQESDISKLPYMRAIVKETLRLHSPIPLLLPRKAEQDIELGGYVIPKGAQILFNAWAIGRDPNAWHDPDSFYPERFLGSDLDVKGQHFDLIPFGTGKRICPGLSLALHMVPLTLAMMVGSFDWKFEDDKDLQEELDMDDAFGITLKKAKPLRAFPIKRA